MNLYFKLPFGQQHSGNKKVQKLAKILARTPGSINMKLNQFAALDDSLDQKGLTNYGNLDEEVWQKYWNNEDEVATLSEYILEQYEEREEPGEEPEFNLDEIKENYGKEVKTEQKRRIGQRFFRNVVLANYEYQCCVCRLNQPKLLEAAHIIKWSDAKDPKLRINPRNGMAMCRIHHRAFDEKIMNIHPEKKIILLAPSIQKEQSQGAKHIFKRFEKERIYIPEKFGPDEELLNKMN